MRWRPLPPALLRTRAAVRPAGRAALGALLAVLVSAVPACSGGDQPAAPTPAPAPELPNTPPDNMTMEVWFTGGRDALTAVRDQVRAEALRTMLPATMAEAFDHLAPVPDSVKPRVRDDAPIVGVRVDDAQVAAALVRTDEGQFPLGVGVTLVDGGPHGSRYVGRAPVVGEPITVLYQDVVLVARDRPELEASLGYLVSRLRSAELGAPGLHIRSAEGVIARRARTELEGAVDEQVAGALAAARAERSAHADAPALGDPEAFVQTVASAVRELTAYMPDIRAMTAWMGPTAHGLGFTLDTELVPGSPAARALARLPEVPSALLGRFPQGTSLGMVLAPAAAGEGVLHALAEVGGQRMRPEDTAAFAALAASQREHAGGALMAGLGATDAGAFALLATPNGPGAEPAAIDAVLATPYMRALLGDLLGCPGDEPRRGLAVAAATPVCTRAPAPVPALHHQRDDAHALLAITQSAAEATPHPLPAAYFSALGAENDSHSLGALPDVSRALDSAAPRVLSAWVIMPGHLGQALGLLASTPARALGGALTLEIPPAPILVFVERTDDGARMRFSLTPGAFDQAARTALMTSQIF
ncbi:MAG: hypothetical protein R3B40_22010 [Polyangiales bacterium]|nr:hypothetical protein [Myxococcales bacterium]MCB9656869.1 hypothetical protein [Sandaracinaceae bacterium]